MIVCNIDEERDQQMSMSRYTSCQLPAGAFNTLLYIYQNIMNM